MTALAFVLVNISSKEENRISIEKGETALTNAVIKFDKPDKNSLFLKDSEITKAWRQKHLWVSCQFVSQNVDFHCQ